MTCAHVGHLCVPLFSSVLQMQKRSPGLESVSASPGHIPEYTNGELRYNGYKGRHPRGMSTVNITDLLVLDSCHLRTVVENKPKRTWE